MLWVLWFDILCEFCSTERHSEGEDNELIEGANKGTIHVLLVIFY